MGTKSDRLDPKFGLRAFFGSAGGSTPPPTYDTAPSLRQMPWRNHGASDGGTKIAKIKTAARAPRIGVKTGPGGPCFRWGPSRGPPMGGPGGAISSRKSKIGFLPISPEPLGRSTPSLDRGVAELGAQVFLIGSQKMRRLGEREKRALGFRIFPDPTGPPGGPPSGDAGGSSVRVSRGPGPTGSGFERRLDRTSGSGDIDFSVFPVRLHVSHTWHHVGRKGQKSPPGALTQVGNGWKREKINNSGTAGPIGSPFET